MRTIKFRRVFKNRVNGEITFMYWGNINYKGEPANDFSSFVSPGNNSHAELIADEQFTGLLDKNGKEIYEGDIVEYENGNCGYGRPRNEEISRNIIPQMTEHEEYADRILSWQQGVIIGNIHDNPELID